MKTREAKKAWEDDTRNIINELLTSAHQVPKIEEYLLEEINYLVKNIPLNSSVIDFGCGNGRHLNILGKQISKGLGIDINKAYLEEANSNKISHLIDFEIGDIENYKSKELFDFAISMYNTFGNIENKKGMIKSMLNSVKVGGKVIISVFSPNSIASRLELYEVMGFKNLDIKGHIIRTEQGFPSECFTKSTLLKLMPSAKIESCTDIGWIVVLEKKRN